MTVAGVRARVERHRLGHLPIDALTLDGAIDAIEDLVVRGEGGTVFTPNVDHIVQAEHDARFREAYASVALSLVDGMPVLWAARMLGHSIPEKVSGSDLISPLMQRAALRGWRVHFLGGASGVPERARELLCARYPGLEIVDVDTSMVDADASDAALEPLAERIRAARADLTLVALGAPKQEIVSHRLVSKVRPCVLVGVGASLDFIAGAATRAPRWMSASGLEWAYRLAHEPRRMWRRYLLRDPKFALVLLREARDKWVR